MSFPDPNAPAGVPRVLVVDDEKVIREILADFLSLEGFYVATAGDGRAALEQLSQAPFDMVISDLKMPKMGGLDLLASIQADHENVLTVIMTGFGTVETAIEAMKRGAYDYILKPFKVEEVVHIVRRGLEKQRLISENVRLREIISLYQLSEELQSSLSVDAVIDSTLSTCAKNVGCDVAAFFLRGEDGVLFSLHRSITHPDAPPGSSAGELNLPLLLAELEAHRAVLAHGHAVDVYFLSPQRDLESFLCVSLVARQTIIGFVAFYSFVSEVKFAEGQRKLVALVASRAAAAMDNAVLYRDLQQTFRETIQGLARALEAMDKYTAGHSDRVTVYARITAQELGESPERVELITQAGMLHDIGKLGCHANLNKPGRLTDEEYEIFKAHPSYGKEILDPITFLRGLVPGVHLHHERWDGKGYPLGLKGEDIPVVARILAVGDSYDAMTSNRAYRRALNHTVAAAELRRCASTQFDPHIVEAFLSAIEKYRAESQQRGLPLPD